MIRRFRNRKFYEATETQNPVTAHDVAKFLKRNGLQVSSAPCPKDTRVDDAECFVALKNNGEFIVLHDLEYDDGNIGVLVMTASWDPSQRAKTVDIFTKEEIERKISELI